MACNGTYIGQCCEESSPNGILYRVVQVIANFRIGSGFKNLAWADERVSQALAILDRYQIPTDWSTIRNITAEIEDTTETIVSDGADFRDMFTVNSSGAANDVTVETTGPRPSYTSSDISFMRVSVSKGIFRARPFIATAYLEDRLGVSFSVDCSRLRTPPEYSIPGNYTFTFTPRISTFDQTGTRLLTFGRYAAAYTYRIAWNQNVIPILPGC